MFTIISDLVVLIMGIWTDVVIYLEKTAWR